MNKQRTLELDKEKILESNPQVDRDLVEKDENLQSSQNPTEQRKGSDFRLSPPLGDGRILLYNH